MTTTAEQRALLAHIKKRGLMDVSVSDLWTIVDCIKAGDLISCDDHEAILWHADTYRGNERADALDLIEAAMLDATDYDVTYKALAAAVLDALIREGMIGLNPNAPLAEIARPVPRMLVGSCGGAG